MRGMMPIIRIEMEGIKAGVMHHMGNHNEAFNKMVQDSLEKTLTEEWVMMSIQDAVNKTMQNAIDNLADNWQLRNAVSEALASALSDMVDKSTSAG